MTNDDLGLWVFGGAMALCVGIAVLVTYVFQIEWFRERLLSGERWTAAAGMLPIAFPVYLLAGLLFSYLRQ
ncbi:MAG: hypothetical protein ACO1OD_08570 [Croceibacterium sp.]